MIKPSAIQQNGVTASIDLLKTSPFLDLRGGAVTGTGAETTSVFEPVTQSFFAGSDGYAPLIFAVILATLLKPTARFYYEQVPVLFQKFGGEGDRTKQTEHENLNFSKTRFYHVVQTVVEAARLIIVVGLFHILLSTILHFLQKSVKRSVPMKG